MKLLLIALFVSLACLPVVGQVEGCTDPLANNYNSKAFINDGSCTYNPAFFKPRLYALLSPDLEETSGLIFFNDGLWSFNDSGGEPVLYKMDTLTVEIIQEITIENATNIDWEDIAQDNTNIYIGDFGNNSGTRDDLVIYIVKKQDIPYSGNHFLTAGSINFYYQDQGVSHSDDFGNNFDCEAMIVKGDSLYLFSKNWGNSKTKLYKLPKTAGHYEAVKTHTYDIKGLVTGADYNEEFNEIILSGYKNEIWIPFSFLLFDFQGNDFFSGNKRRIDFPYIISSQTEGICYYKNRNVFISAEKTKTHSERLYQLNTGQWTGGSAAGFISKSREEIDFNIHPNPVQGKTFRIKIPDIPERSCMLEIYDSLGKTVFVKNYNFERSGNVVRIKINCKDFNHGIYLVKLRCGDIYGTNKLLIE